MSYGKYGNVSILGVGYWESMSRLENFMRKDVQGMYFEWETSRLWNCIVTISDRGLCNFIGNSHCDFCTMTLWKDHCIKC